MIVQLTSHEKLDVADMTPIELPFIVPVTPPRFQDETPISLEENDVST